MRVRVHEIAKHAGRAATALACALILGTTCAVAQETAPAAKAAPKGEPPAKAAPKGEPPAKAAPKVGPPAKTFATPEDAAAALLAAARADDTAALVEIFGPGSRPIVSSGDPVADAATRERFVREYDAKHSLEPAGEGSVDLVIGEDEWPFPLPLVKDGERWRFDLREGRQEILNRRIGRNELHTIQGVLAYVDAQREYYERNPLDGAKPQYAQRIASTPGKKDGLFWETAPDEDPSPLGPVFAAARAEGYEPGTGSPIPYHGYYYRVLLGQGDHAIGGAKDYVVDGAMTGGFALVASPARWGASGIMTFLVSGTGIVYQKDLGPETAQAVAKMKTFDPDDTWSVVTGDALDPPSS